MVRGRSPLSFGTQVVVLVGIALGVTVVVAPVVGTGVEALRDAAPEAARSLGIREVEGGWDFGRVFRRLAMLSALVCGFALRRRLPRVRPRGIARGDRRSVRLLSGFLFGIATFSAFLVGLVGLGELRFDPAPAGAWLPGLLEAALVGLVVGAIEEAVVRGWLQQGLTGGRLGLAPAVAITAGVYAVLHYFRAGVPVTDGVGWDLGVRALAAHAGAMVAPGILGPALGLFLVGASLGYAYAWSGSLPFAIGVHAGWVAVIKGGGLVFDRSLSLGWLWGPGGVLGTPWAWLWLAGTIPLVRLWLRRPLNPRALFAGSS